MRLRPWIFRALPDWYHIRAADFLYLASSIAEIATYPCYYFGLLPQNSFVSPLELVDLSYRVQVR